MIQLENITKLYSEENGIRKVSFSVNAGERVIIVGPSGSGKTTLLRVLAGLEVPQDGTICLDGKKVNDPRIIVAPSQRNIGMVFQDLALWPHMTVYQHLDFGLVRTYPAKKDRREAIAMIVDHVNLLSKIQENVTKLSGGERQRVALARALVRRPKILLMDEPLSNLDYELKQRMVDWIIRLQEEFRMTLIYVTHDRSVEQELGQRILVMKDGFLLGKS